MSFFLSFFLSHDFLIFLFILSFFAYFFLPCSFFFRFILPIICLSLSLSLSVCLSPSQPLCLSFFPTCKPLNFPNLFTPHTENPFIFIFFLCPQYFFFFFFFAAKIISLITRDFFSIHRSHTFGTSLDLFPTLFYLPT